MNHVHVAVVRNTNNVVVKITKMIAVQSRKSEIVQQF